MTTPQSELWRLSSRIHDLIELFETQEDELSIFEHVKQLYIRQQDLLKRMDRIEGQMALIIKFLGKDE